MRGHHSVSSEQSSERSGQQPPTSSKQPATSNEFVLIVEDNADMRAFIGESLRDKYRIIEAPNGEEGFVKAQDTSPISSSPM